MVAVVVVVAAAAAVGVVEVVETKGATRVFTMAPTPPSTFPSSPLFSKSGGGKIAAASKLSASTALSSILRDFIVPCLL